jgi:hypothetical protein
MRLSCATALRRASSRILSFRLTTTTTFAETFTATVTTIRNQISAYFLDFLDFLDFLVVRSIPQFAGGHSSRYVPKFSAIEAGDPVESSYYRGKAHPDRFFAAVVSKVLFSYSQK